MSEKYVTVAAFSVPLEAQMAAGHLQGEGIPAFVTGDVTADTFSGISGLGGTVRVQVPESELKKALDLLATCAREPPPDADGDEDFDPEEGVWVCSLCGEPVQLEQDACPACRTPREAIRSAEPNVTARPLRKTAPPQVADKVQQRDQLTADSPPLPEHELAEEGPDLPPAETFLGDDLARRAFRCAVFGCCTLFLGFTLYSLWLQLRLSLFPRELSPTALGKLRWTFLMNVALLLLWTLFLWGGLYYLPRLD